MFKLKASWISTAVAALVLAFAPAASATDPGIGSLRISNSHAAYAVLISPTKAIVPAHAVGGALASYSVLFGSSDRTVTTCSTCELRSLVSAVRHPNYNSSTGANDIAVITFSALTLNANVQTMTLAQTTDTTPAVGATVVGVGCYNTTTHLLQDVNLIVSSNTGNTIVTQPSPVSLGASCITYAGKVHGLFNMGTATGPQTFSKIASYYSWIIAQ